MTHRTRLSGYAAAAAITSSGNEVTGDPFNFRLKDGHPRASRAVWMGVRRGWVQVSPWADCDSQGLCPYVPAPPIAISQPRTSYGRYGNDGNTGAL